MKVHEAFSPWILYQLTIKKIVSNRVEVERSNVRISAGIDFVFGLFEVFFHWKPEGEIQGGQSLQ